MKIRILRSCGKATPWRYSEGDVVEAGQREAEDLVAAGLAVALPGEVRAIPPPPVEEPVNQSVEEAEENLKTYKRRAKRRETDAAN